MLPKIATVATKFFRFFVFFGKMRSGKDDMTGQSSHNTMKEKQLGVRISKSLEDRLDAFQESTGMTPVSLARHLLEITMDLYEKNGGKLILPICVGDGNGCMNHQKRK